MSNPTYIYPNPTYTYNLINNERQQTNYNFTQQKPTKTTQEIVKDLNLSKYRTYSDLNKFTKYQYNLKLKCRSGHIIDHKEISYKKTFPCIVGQVWSGSVNESARCKKCHTEIELVSVEKVVISGLWSR